MRRGSRTGRGRVRVVFSGVRMTSRKCGKCAVRIRIIVAAKLLKAAVLIAVGVAVLAMAGHDPPTFLADVATGIGLAPRSRHLGRLTNAASCKRQGERGRAAGE